MQPVFLQLGMYALHTGKFTLFVYVLQVFDLCFQRITLFVSRINHEEAGVWQGHCLGGRPAVQRLGSVWRW